MSEQRGGALNAPVVRKAFRQAWQDSQPGTSDGHEEGGFIVKDPSGNLRVIRWPKGEQNVIALPPHPNCKIGEEDIVATFHTHPNTGPDFLQEPSETDRRAVEDDPALKGTAYEGEFVISQRTVYLNAPTGQVSEVGSTREMLET